MMRNLIFMTVLSLNVLVAAAQKTVKDVLAEIPESIVPYINAGQREEISKFTGGNDTIKVKNELNGFTTVSVEGDGFARIELNGSASVQMKLLTLNDTAQVICVVKTMETPVPESIVDFYSVDWVPVDFEFGLPESDGADALLAEFTQRPDTMTEARFEYLRRCIEPVMVKVSVEPGKDVLTYSLSVPFASKDEARDINAIIKQKYYKWTGDSFKIY